MIKILESKGFFFVSQKGSHLKYRKTGKNTFTVIIPHPKKEMPLGTFRSILRQSSLSEADFENKKQVKHRTTGLYRDVS